MDLTWMGKAACRGMNTNMFYEEKVNGVQFPISYVKDICRNCPVRDECLEYVLKYESPYGLNYGIAGGLTAFERQKILRKRNHELGTSVPNDFGKVFPNDFSINA